MTAPCAFTDRTHSLAPSPSLAAGLTLLREQAGLSQHDLAKRLGVSQPRIAAIERSKNVTVELLEQYVEALGGRLQVTVVKGNKRTTLISAAPHSMATKSARRVAKKAPAKKVVRRMPAKRARQIASPSALKESIGARTPTSWGTGLGLVGRHSLS